MKKFIKSVICFVPFLIIEYSLLIFIWGSFAPQLLKPNLNYKIGSPGYMHSRLQEAKKINSIDVLFLGSSHAYRDFDTRLFEKQDLKAFNLGSSAQTPIQTDALLSRYLDQLKPCMVIYEVYPATFSIDGVESAVDIIASDRNDFNSIKMAFHLNQMKVYNTLLYAFMQDILNLNSSFTEPIQKGDDTYISGGYVEKKITYFKYVDYPSGTWKFNDSQIVAFEEVLLMLKERNIRHILVYAPITSSLYNSYSNNNTFDSIMAKHGEYYNYNKLINLDDSLHFYDKDHLNQDGVQIFNTKLIEIIKEH